MRKAFECLSKQETLHLLKTDASAGLSAGEWQRRLIQDGKNVFAEKKRQPAALRFLKQFNDPLIYILLAAVIISLALGEIADSIIILVVIIVNGIVGYIQESRAERAIDALKKLSSPRAVVLRDGRVLETEASDLVKGDVVLLEAGRQVPADLRLIESANLRIEESALTGESVPAEKDSDFIAAEGEPLGNRANMAYMSTNVAYGRGAGVVTATGMETEIGRIAEILASTREEMTPLQKRLADLGKLLGILAVGISALLFIVAVIQKRNILDMLLTAISLSVAAIPEGMPAVVTIVLAAGVSRMAKSRTIVRRLPAVETLGAVNVVCTDKTGTLTQNRMTVTECRIGAGLTKPEETAEEEKRLFYEGFVLCNDASIENGEAVGDPTETALLEMGARAGLRRPELEKRYPRIDEIPFDSVRKMMTTLHRLEGGTRLFTKGALDSILRVTEWIQDGETIRPITPEDRERIMAEAAGLAGKALRVLALAYRGDPDGLDEKDLIFIGIEGMIDPPRPEAQKAVEDCRMAGITTVMITGDHRDTAFAIAKELGIAQEPGQVISGDRIDRMTQEELNQKVGGLRVFARVSPENKVAIVRAFRASGNIVSMTGDGVNDAPSLKSADIGIAMGITGTDVAKGAADMILTDDNFATVRTAIETGRNIYNNIRKSVLYLLASNLGEILTMVVAVLLGFSAPLTAAQILWVNLVTDSLPGLALGVDTGDPRIMEEKPRSPRESLFARGGILLLAIYGILIGGVTLAGFSLGVASGGLRLGRTMAVTVLSLSQLFHGIGMRNINRSVFKMNHLENKLMLVAFLAGALLQAAIVQIPVIGRFFSTQPMSASQWLIVLLLSVTPVLVHELLVLFRNLMKKVRTA